MRWYYYITEGVLIERGGEHNKEGDGNETEKRNGQVISHEQTTQERYDRRHAPRMRPW